MKESPFRLVPFDPALDRTSFDCGTEALNRYLRQQAGQDVRRRVAACFVALTPELRVAGYYTLASASISLTDLPKATIRKLPRYPSVPTVRMGRLAVDRAFGGQGLGAALLADALLRASRSEIAAYAMMVDAKNDQAASFYQHHGFISLPASPLTLFLPLSTIQSLPST